tara:strand:+ start:296 stop:1297 length:1002 start_codon:yes stop_codon:yes gene_type:complete
MKKKTIHPFKTLFVGSGNIVLRHINSLRKLKNTKIKILKRSSSKIDTKLKEYSFIKNFSEAKKFKPNATFICSPASIHISDFRKLRNVCFNFFLEKPLTSTNLNLNNFLINLKKKYYFYVGYMLTFSPVLKYISKILKEKKFGKFYYAKCYVGQNLQKWRPQKKYYESVSAQKKFGGGPLYELSHEIEYCLDIFGIPKAVFNKNFKLSKMKIDVNDISSISFYYDKYFVDIIIDFLNHKKKRSIELVFEKANIYGDLLSNKLKIEKKNKKTKEISFKKKYEDLYEDQMKFFIKNLNKKDEKIYRKLENSINTVKLIKLLEQSNLKDKIIRVKI